MGGNSIWRGYAIGMNTHTHCPVLTTFRQIATDMGINVWPETDGSPMTWTYTSKSGRIHAGIEERTAKELLAKYGGTISNA